MVLRLMPFVSGIQELYGMGDNVPRSHRESCDDDEAWSSSSYSSGAKNY